MNKSKYEIIEDAILNLEVVICKQLDVDLDHPLIRIHIEHMRNELEDMQENDHPIDFYDDAEKMADFRMLSKEEFLKSYSYLTEQEHEITKQNMERLLKENLELRQRLACIEVACDLNNDSFMQQKTNQLSRDEQENMYKQIT